MRFLPGFSARNGSAKHPTAVVTAVVDVDQAAAAAPSQGVGGVGGSGSLVTCTVIMAFDAPQLPKPLYAAVITCAPSVVNVVVSDAWPLALTGTVSSRFEPSKNVTPSPP